MGRWEPHRFVRLCSLEQPGQSSRRRGVLRRAAAATGVYAPWRRGVRQRRPRGMHQQRPWGVRQQRCRSTLLARDDHGEPGRSEPAVPDGGGISCKSVCGAFGQPKDCSMVVGKRRCIGGVSTASAACGYGDSL